MITLEQKKQMSFAVKSNEGVNHKEVDLSRRTVDVIANTYNYFDSDYDVFLVGACAKSILDRGPKSELPGKIKHLSNHDLQKGVGRPDLIEETQIDGKYVLHANSYMSETSDGETTLIKYQEGLIDQHSIGYQYLDLEFIEAESEAFDEAVKSLINPEDAIDAGFMFLVKEIKLYEFSSLDGFGANRLTPFLGVKSENKNVQYNNLIAKLDALHSAMRTGVKDKELIELQEKQIKQMIFELYNEEPDIKKHLSGPPKNSTSVDVGKYLSQIKILN